MSWRISLVTAVVLVGVGVSPVTAWDGPLFDFRGEFPVPGGTMRLETRCVREAEGVRCRAQSRGPAGRGFNFEGRLLIWPQAPTVTSDPSPPPVTGPLWF